VSPTTVDANAPTNATTSARTRIHPIPVASGPGTNIGRRCGAIMAPYPCTRRRSSSGIRRTTST
jgi:hypothetical protein